MLKYVDAHNHIIKGNIIKCIYNTYCYEDILNIQKVGHNYINIGLHPLYLNENLDYSFIKLLLKNNKYNIGEVGLDKRGENKELQSKILLEFIDLANNYNKSVTFHCVKSWGAISDIIKSRLNKDLPHLYHSFNGSYETMKTLLNGNSFFSFSLNDLKRDKIIQIIKSIPIEKLLIESDMVTEVFNDLGSELYIKQIVNTYLKVAEIKEITENSLVSIILNNFNRFIKE